MPLPVILLPAASEYPYAVWIPAPLVTEYSEPMSLSLIHSLPSDLTCPLGVTDTTPALSTIAATAELGTSARPDAIVQAWLDSNDAPARRLHSSGSTSNAVFARRFTVTVLLRLASDEFSDCALRGRLWTRA